MPAPGQALLDRSADAPPARTLLDVLRATTVRHPEASAIDDGSGALSYRELMARVGATAARLHEAGVRRGDRVGVRMPSGSKELYISILGILAAAAPFFGEIMMGWLVDSSSVSIVITYLLVSAVFIVLRRREPEMDRPLRIGGRSAAGGIAVGVAAVITTACLLALYVPGMPAMLDVQPYVILGLWWLLGVVFLVRVPGGVAPGEDAEERLLERLAERRSSAS